MIIPTVNCEVKQAVERERVITLAYYDSNIIFDVATTIRFPHKFEKACRFPRQLVNGKMVTGWATHSFPSRQ
jgi:hypothetical protein